MKKIIIFLSALTFSCASPQIAVNKKADFSKIKRVAVLNFSGPQGDAAADIMTITLLKYGADVVERQQIDSVIKELNLNQSNLIEQHNRKKIGRMLSIDALFVGSVINFKPNTKYLVKNSAASFDSIKEIKGKNIYTQNLDSSSDTTILETTAEVALSVRMIDIETGSVIWSAYMGWEGLDTTTTISAITEYFVKSLKRVWQL
ncbi:MAG: CsgG/HfaB family protein [Elusimicrobiota bacterium]